MCFSYADYVGHMCENPDQVYMECGTACPPTCKNPNPYCTRQCVAGCQCPRGTVLDESTDRCVAEQECPRKCEQPHAIMHIESIILYFVLAGNEGSGIIWNGKKY